MEQKVGAPADAQSRLGGAWNRPRRFRADNADPASRAAATHAPAVAHGAERARILVAEDHLALQVLTCRMLAALGASPSLAVDGAQAYTLACANGFDLILMDLQMPVLDGLAATRQIRRFEQVHGRPRVPVVAYTSYQYRGSEPYLLRFGIDAVLEKPCTRQSLQECLLSWVPQGRVVGNVRAPGRRAPAQPA